MCYEISSENFLANYFANSEQDSVSLSELKVLRKKIESELKNQIYIDLTYDSLAEAELNNPSLFLLEDDGRSFRRNQEKNTILIQWIGLTGRYQKILLSYIETQCLILRQLMVEFSDDFFKTGKAFS